jgi:hypothetical protein
LRPVCFLTAAAGAIAASAIVKANDKEEWLQFIAHGAPTFLILGLYNKMVKQNGTAARTRRTSKAELASG